MLAILLLASLALPTAVAEGENKVLIVTTLPVLDYLAKLVGGNYTEVLSLVPPGANPHTYEPSPKDLEEVMKADIILASGLHHTKLEEVIEKYVEEGKVRGTYLDVNTYKLYGLKLIEVNGKPSPHGFWWSPRDLAAVTLALGDALAKKDPSHATYYKARAEEIAEKALSLSNALQGLRVAVYSPPDMYFAEGCGAKVVLMLSPSPGSTPTPDKVQELLSLKGSIDVLIVSYVDLSMSKGAREIVKRFEESGGRVAIVPLGAPSWDPLSSIVAGVWSVMEVSSAGELQTSNSSAPTLSYSDVALALIAGIAIGVGVMVAWARRVCG